MANLVDAKYVSIWNDGETEVWSNVTVDFDEMAIVYWGNRWYEGYEPADDGELVNLVEEKVVTPFGLEYTALPADDYNQTLAECEGDEAEMGAYDNYGNGIIVYDA